VKMMSIVGLLIIIISGLGFGNLQAAHQLSTLKSMGIKLINGASKGNLCTEMIVSRIFLFVICANVSYLSFELAFPYYLEVLDIAIDRHRLLDLISISGATFVIVAFSIFFGMLQIHRVQIDKSLKNQLKSMRAPTLQRALTTVQYGISIALLIFTIVIFRQFNYMLAKDIGFEPSNVIGFKSVIDESSIYSDKNMTSEGRKAEAKARQATYQYFLDQLGQNPAILSVSQADVPVTSVAYPMSWKFLGGDFDYTTQNLMTIDPNYAELLGLKMAMGRFFLDTLDKSRQNRVVINEAAMNYWQIDDISKAEIANRYWGGEAEPFKVIGVVKDFHYEHLSYKVKPLLLLYMRDMDRNFIVKIQEGKEKEVIGYIKDLFEKLNPNHTFNYTWLTDQINSQYAKEKRMSRVYLGFTAVALIISSIGLFTFALFETRRRTKEIGIRKVTGANIEHVVLLLCRSFLKPIAIAFFVACPMAWYASDKWLEAYANRIQISWPVFTLAGLLAVLLAVVAVSWQTWNVAKKNPVESLRYE
jgi:putative ABC transport system permease protein